MKCVINPDSHRNSQTGFLRLAVGAARKGWLTKADMINALPLTTLMKERNRNRNRAR